MWGLVTPVCSGQYGRQRRRHKFQFDVHYAVKFSRFGGVGAVGVRLFVRLQAGVSPSV